jgi:hypothetical protein
LTPDLALLLAPALVGAAVRTRQGLARGIGWLRGGAARAGLRSGPVGVWVGEHKRVLRVGAVAVAGLALVFWGRPTGKVVILLALLLLVALALIEFLGQPTKARSDRDDAFRSPPAGLESRNRIP